jgi:hypothetical protein
MRSSTDIKIGTEVVYRVLVRNPLDIIHPVITYESIPYDSDSALDQIRNFVYKAERLSIRDFRFDITNMILCFNTHHLLLEFCGGDLRKPKADFFFRFKDVCY